MFATSAISCCGKKSIKIKPTSFQKQLSNQHSNLHRFWEPTWTHFGRVWGVKMATSWHQIAPKIDLQIDHKNDHLSDRSWNRFWSILAPKIEPKRGAQKSIFEVLGALGAILGPRWPKTPPRQLCGPILIDFCIMFDRLLIDFWLFFDRFLKKIQTISIQFSSAVTTTRATNRSTDHQTVKELISYSINQSIIVGTVAGWPKAVG